MLKIKINKSSEGNNQSRVLLITFIKDSPVYSSMLSTIKVRFRITEVKGWDSEIIQAWFQSQPLNL